MSTTQQHDDAGDSGGPLAPSSVTGGADTTPDPARRRRLERRRKLAALGAGALMAVGIVLAAASPPWLVDPLREFIEASGPAAPVVFVLLVIAATPLHLNGILIVLSTLFWSTPVAFTLSFVGTFLGCVLTVWGLVLVGTKPARQRDGWPAWLERLSHRVSRRPYVVGLVARNLLDSGLALEAFFVLTGYTRRRYLVTTVIGVAMRVIQAFVAVAALRAAIAQSPTLGALFVVAPILLVVVFMVVLRRRRRAAAVSEEG